MTTTTKTHPQPSLADLELRCEYQTTNPLDGSVVDDDVVEEVLNTGGTDPRNEVSIAIRSAIVGILFFSIWGRVFYDRGPRKTSAAPRIVSPQHRRIT